MLSKETFEINSTEHRKAQRISKIRNLAKGNKNPAEKAAAEKKAGGPKLVGEMKKVEEAAFLAGMAKAAMGAAKGAVKQKAKEVVAQKAANVARGAIPQPNRDQQESVDVEKTEDAAQKKMNQIKKQVLLKKLQAVRSGGGETVTASHHPEGEMTEGVGRAAIGAGVGAMVGGPVGAAAGAAIGASLGKKKVTSGGKKVKKKATNFFKAEPKVTSSEGVVSFVKKGLDRDKKAKEKKKIKDRKAVPYAALAAEHQPEGELVDEAAPLAAIPAVLAKGAIIAGKVAASAGKAVAKGASVAGKAAVKGTKAVGKAAGEGIKAGAKTAGQTVAVAAGDAGASVVKSAGEGAAERVKKKIAGEPIAASYEPELSIVEKMLIEYSPNVTYQDKKKGKLGKSSIYSLRDKDESKKDFRKSHVKDVEDGYVGKGHKPTPGSLKKEDWKPEITHSKMGDATKKAAEKKKKEAQKGLPPHLQGDWLAKARKAFKENYRVLARDKGDKGRPAQFSYKDEKLAKKFADSVKSKGGKATVAKEGTYDEPNLEKRKSNNEKARKELKKDAKDSGYTDIALKASMSKGAGVSESKATAKLAAKVLKDKEPCNECGSVAHVTGQCPKKDHDIGEGVMDIVNRYKKKKEEKKPQKAQDAGARARRVLKRREYQSKVSAIVPAELEDQKVWDKIKKYI